MSQVPSTGPERKTGDFAEIFGREFSRNYLDFGEKGAVVI